MPRQCPAIPAASLEVRRIGGQPQSRSLCSHLRLVANPVQTYPRCLLSRPLSSDGDPDPGV